MALAILGLTACSARPGDGPHAPSNGQGTNPDPNDPNAQVVDELTISPHSQGELDKMFHDAQGALLHERYAEAAAAFDKLARMSPDFRMGAPSLFNAGVAYVGLGDDDMAVSRFEEQIKRFPAAPTTRASHLRLLRAYGRLERWEDLGRAADRALSHPDLAVLDAIEAHGARALSAVYRDELDLALTSVATARDLIEDNRLGESGTPPTQLAPTWFALGEVRRLRGEEITFNPVPANFADVLESRCQMLLDAQSAYSDAMRTRSSHWSAMAGYRIGQLYQQLHRDVMEVPPPVQAESLEKKQLFEGAMRLRYRVLLDKGLKMMKATVAMAERTGEGSAWVLRARDAERELELALADEKAAMAKLPFTEEELQAALDKLKKPSP